MTALNTGIFCPVQTPAMRTAFVALSFSTNGSGDPTGTSPQGASVTRSGTTYVFNIGRFKRLLYAQAGFAAEPTAAPILNINTGTVTLTYTAAQLNKANIQALFLVEV